MTTFSHYPNLFGENYELADTYNEPTQLLDAMYYPCQEAAYQGQQQLPNNGHGNWLSDYGSCFDDCWGDNFFSYSDTTQGDECTGDSHQTEEQYDTDFSYNEDTENEPAYDYNPCYGSCSEYIEEIYNKYSEPEVRPTNTYNLDDMGFCEGIFGYWPCLTREIQRQAAYVETINQ